MLRLCSNDSSVLYRGVTPRRPQSRHVRSRCQWQSRGEPRLWCGLRPNRRRLSRQESQLTAVELQFRIQLRLPVWRHTECSRSSGGTRSRGADGSRDGIVGSERNFRAGRRSIRSSPDRRLVLGGTKACVALGFIGWNLPVSGLAAPKGRFLCVSTFSK
jgi:hypothetical protein